MICNYKLYKLMLGMDEIPYMNGFLKAAMPINPIWNSSF